MGKKSGGRGAWAKAVAPRLCLALLVAGSASSGRTFLQVDAALAADPCAPPVTNPIVCENSLPGNPESEWLVSGSGDSSIQGFGTDISVNRGGTIGLKVRTDARAYTINIYRVGYYGGNGARKVAGISPSAALPQTQPACRSDSATGLVDCGNWALSASWTVPSTAVSGLYLANLVRSDTGGTSQIPFVVRDDSSASPLLFQTSDTTWQAYNEYGGNSLYTGSPAGRAYKVSYNRPFITEPINPASWFLGEEYPMIRWLEANGYHVAYASGVDSDRRGALIRNHKVFLSVGHDEYWSGSQRANVEAARNSGVNLAFFSGNESFWKTRWESSIDGTNTAYRTLVSYKETHANAVIDPADPPTWTGTWRDPRFSPPADGGRPENGLSGTIFMVNGTDLRTLLVPAADGKMRFWRSTSIATLGTGQTASLTGGCNCILGSEWDEDLDNGFRPPGLVRMSSSSHDVPALLQDYGSNYAPGTATHHLTLYRASSGALIFSAGSFNWSWGLDGDHDIMPSTPEPAMQQATVNLFADMGVQPGSLQPGLTAATASTDTVSPRSTITAPSPGATLNAGTAVTITGTAADTGGGMVGGVEVSTDGGTTWHPANGRESWTYAWTPGSSGTVTIKSRAADDSGNLETPAAGVTVNVQARQCPCSIWSPSTTPAVSAANDASAVELGLKFTADVNGSVTGVRFYKDATNTGTHVGNLWSSSGSLLAGATFSNETASGWQQVSFSSPVAITANTTYVVSYHTNVGNYSQDLNYFSNNGVDNSPLHALSSPASGGNGVYQYGSSSAFPNQSFQGSNYWVDVVFATTTASGPPAVVSESPAPNATGVSRSTAVTATFNKAVTPSSISMVLKDPSGASVAGTLSYNSSTLTASFQPAAALATNTTYTATVSGAIDSSGSVMTPFSWSFTTKSCPCTIWSSSAAPATISGDASAVELGLKFTADVSGRITGVRFYKGAGNTGTHVGNLWSSSGTLLATATFTNETASGWQQVSFSSPVAITAGATYVVSYHTNTGHYGQNLNFFTSDGVDNSPLHAPSSPASGGNGVYQYGSTSVFPNQTFQGSNYWVDVVFTS